MKKGQTTIPIKRINMKCLECNNLARWYRDTLMFRLCEDHKRLQSFKMEKIPFVTDMGKICCLRCGVEWLPYTFMIDPGSVNQHRYYRHLEGYMDIQKYCPLCRSPYWMLPRLRGTEWRGNIKTPKKRRYVNA